MYRCAGCGVWFTDALHGTDLAALYTKEYFLNAHVAPGYADYHRLADALQRTAIRRLGHLERIAGRHRVLLDIGCGTGEFLRVASHRGWRCQGVEVSAYAADYGRTRYGLAVHTGALEPGLFPARSFSAITLWDVIEHLPDPAATLRICAQLLRAGGVLMLSTGDVESVCARICRRHWHLFNVPEHVFFFSPRSIRALLRAAGFGRPSIAHPGAYYPAGYLLERAYKTVRPRGAAMPAFAWPWLVPCNLFDIMQVTATIRHAG